MKKKSLLFIALLFLLSGCGQKPSVDHPYEINYRGKTLSYYDTEDEIDTDVFDILENKPTNLLDNEKNTILVNEDGEIRCISILDSDIITYKSISVGDNVSKIEKSFDNVFIGERSSSDATNYMVVFNGDDIEEDPTNQNKEDSWIWIGYITENSKIIMIRIYDVKYGYKMM